MEKFDGNVNELEVLSKGYWGTIYILSDDYLLKTSTTSEEMIFDEYRRSKAVYESGVPCTEIVKLVETEKGPGIIVGRMQGRSIARRASQHLESLDTYLDAFVKLGKMMWTIRLPDGTLPSVKDDLLGITGGLREFMDGKTVDEYVDFVHALPDGDTFLHMDFHWGNIMYNNGDAKIIDMPNAAVGHPAFDLMSAGNAYYWHVNFDFEGKSYEDVFRISKEEGIYVWDGLCKRVFAGLPEDLAADRKKCVELMTGFVYVKNFMRDYFLGIATAYYINGIKNFLETFLRDDKDFALRVLNEWKV